MNKADIEAMRLAIPEVLEEAAQAMHLAGRQRSTIFQKDPNPYFESLLEERRVYVRIAARACINAFIDEIEKRP